MIDKNIQENLRSIYNPDGSNLRNQQLRMLEMLKYFDNICKKNNIKYWLSSGTCLGAIRHEGFIPWDDDTDVEMYREDFLKLEKVFVESENYVLQTWKNDSYYNLPFAKIRDKNSIIYDSLYTYKGIFIDIFIIEKVPKSMSRFALKFSGKLNEFYTKAKQNNNASKTKYFLFKKLNFIIIIPAIRLLSKCINLFFHSDYRHTIGCSWINNIRKSEEIGNTRPVLFEGVLLPVPENYHQYLTRIYGDYMALPHKEQIQPPHAEYLRFIK